MAVVRYNDDSQSCSLLNTGRVGYLQDSADDTVSSMELSIIPPLDPQDDVYTELSVRGSTYLKCDGGEDCCLAAR